MAAMALPLSPPFVHPQSTQAPARWQLHQHRHLSHHRCYGRSTVVSDLDGVGVCPECQMAEVGKSWTITKSVQRSDG
jgi:hypothetical protein